MKPARIAAFGLAVASAPALTQASPGDLKLAFPLACRIGVTCEVQNYFDRDPGAGVRDYRCGRRTYDGHNGVDIRLIDMAAQRRGVDVLAAAAGRVARLRDGVADVSIRAPGAAPVKNQECGNGVVVDHGNGWETQYCHLAKGSVKVKVGDQVAAGTPIARVGLSGATEFPHLHLSVRRGTTAIDPFAPTPDAGPGCAPQASLWTAAAAKALSYKAGALLKAGFSAAPVTLAQLAEGPVATPGREAASLIAYFKAVGLQRGDEVGMTLLGPGGAILATVRNPPLAADKAEWMAYVGKRRPATGWPTGSYQGLWQVHRKGAVVLRHRMALKL